MNKLRILIMALVTITFVASSSLQVNAETPTPTPTPTKTPTPAKQGLFGIVRAIDATSLTLVAGKDPSREYNIGITSDTRVKVPSRKNALISDIKVGDRVAVLASVADSRYTALHIVFVPGKALGTHLQGMVTGVTGSVVTLMDKKGETYTLQLGSNVTPPTVGQFIVGTVIQDPSTKQLVLLTYETSERIIERLEKHFDKLQELKPASTDEENKRVAALARLSELLNRNAEKQIQLMETVLAKAPDQAKSALTKVLERAKDRKESITQKIAEKSDKLAKPSPSPAPKPKP